MDLFEHIQLLDDLLQALILIPHEIETQLASLLVLQVYIKVMVGRNVLGYAVECDIVKTKETSPPVSLPMRGEWSDLLTVSFAVALYSLFSLGEELGVRLQTAAMATADTKSRPKKEAATLRSEE